MRGAARLRLFYFLYYAGVGTTLPFFAPYLQGLGFTGAEIGAAQMVGPLLSAPAGLAWAAFADRLGAATRALRLAALGALLPTLLLPFVHTPLSVAAVLLAQALSAGAVVPLVDGVSVEYLRAHDQSYARTRLFGSVGYIVFAQGVGLLLSARGDLPGDPLVPWTMLACVAAYALTAQLAPEAPVASAHAHASDLRSLLADPRLRSLLLVSALHWADCAPYHLFYGVFVREHALPARLTGLGMAVGVIAEVIVLWLAGTLERRFSIRSLLTLSFAATALRWLLLSRASSALAIVALQGLHGLTFGLFWATVVRALAEYVPPRLRVTGQALFAAVVFGAGNALGYQLAGWAYDAAHAVAPLFALAAGLELLPLVLTLRPTTR
jgi:PPP family 3-phenylpropionic acid transporter